MLDDVLENIKSSEQKVQLVAVTKGRSVEDIKQLYDKGLRIFGESYVQEALEKIPQLPSDIAWHFIGTLQTKKVPKVIGKFALIHSIDSLDLAKKVSKVSQERHITTDILLEVNISQEATKHGFSPEGLIEAFSELIALPNIRVRGLMTMAPNTQDSTIIRRVFQKAKELQQTLQTLHSECTELSMGMSGDFVIAIECGATFIRIGSRLFTFV